MRDIRDFRSLLLAIAGLGLNGDAPLRSAPRPDDAEPLRGSIHLRIDDPADPDRRNLRLDQRGALPLKAGDRFRIEVKLNRPAYLYVFWLGSDGKVAPIHPWAPGHWDRRPAAEAKKDRLDLPAKADQAWEVPAGSPGLETVVLLAREHSPLPRDVDLSRLATGLPVPSRPGLVTAVWIENGREVTLDPKDRAVPGSKTRKSDDPVLRIRKILRDKVQPMGDYSQAVLFPIEGENDRFGSARVSRHRFSELVKESDGRFQIANCKFINVFEIRLYVHSQFGIRHPESISSHLLSSARASRPRRSA